MRNMVVVIAYGLATSTSTSMTTKSDDYKFLEPWLGSGLLLVSG